MNEYIKRDRIYQVTAQILPLKMLHFCSEENIFPSSLKKIEREASSSNLLEIFNIIH